MNPTSASKRERKVNTSLFTRNVQDKLMDMISTLNSNKSEQKYLFVLPEAKVVLNAVLNVAALKENKVSLVTMDEESLSKYNDEVTKTLIFLIPPSKAAVSVVKTFHNMLLQRQLLLDPKQLAMFVYPKNTVMSKYFMDQEKLLISFENNIYDFNFDLIPLDEDLLSLEYQPTIQEMYITSEFTGYNLVAESILWLELVYGKIPCKLVKGDKSKIVYDILKRYETEAGNKASMEEESRHAHHPSFQRNRRTHLDGPQCRHVDSVRDSTELPRTDRRVPRHRDQQDLDRQVDTFPDG